MAQEKPLQSKESLVQEAKAVKKDRVIMKTKKSKVPIFINSL